MCIRDRLITFNEADPSCRRRSLVSVGGYYLSDIQILGLAKATIRESQKLIIITANRCFEADGKRFQRDGYINTTYAILRFTDILIRSYIHKSGKDVHPYFKYIQNHVRVITTVLTKEKQITCKHRIIERKQ